MFPDIQGKASKTKQKQEKREEGETAIAQKILLSSSFLLSPFQATSVPALSESSVATRTPGWCDKVGRGEVDVFLYRLFPM